MKVANCLLIKEENTYLREHVEYYKDHGYDNIILYDNNDIDGEHPSEVIADYINSGYIIYNDVRGWQQMQKQIYTKCLFDYGNLYDWISFFDADEFPSENIKKIVSDEKFNDYEEILINWTLIDDGNLIDSDLPVLKRECQALDSSVIKHGWLHNWVVKSIVRGTCKNTFFKSCHHTSGLPTRCNCQGLPVYPCWLQKPIQGTPTLLHFRTKTITEYIKRIKKGDAIFKNSLCLMYTKLNNFFVVNECTEEKVSVIKEHFPDWDNIVIKSKNIDAVIISDTPVQQSLKDAISRYMPFVKKIWVFKDFAQIKDNECSERVVVLKDNVVFNHACIEQDFFLENGVMSTNNNSVLPVIKSLCRDSLESTKELHRNLGKVFEMQFCVGDSRTKISVI